MTAVGVAGRPTAAEPNPCGDTRGDTPANKCFRGLATAIDESAVLWLCDKLIPMLCTTRSARVVGRRGLA
jgi:hypothetical protein